MAEWLRRWITNTRGFQTLGRTVADTHCEIHAWVQTSPASFEFFWFFFSNLNFGLGLTHYIEIYQSNMPELQIDNVRVDFPKQPYPCQVDYMAQVVKALSTGTNALLESPTGTGKTLCLLCSSLSWQQNARKKMEVPTFDTSKINLNAKKQAVPSTAPFTSTLWE